MRLSTASAWAACCALVFSSSEGAAFCRKATCTGASCKKEDGCTVDGAKLQWKSRCISYSFSELGSRILDPSRARVAIENAFEAWSLVDCGGRPATMTFSLTEDVACDRAEHNASGANVNVIIFRDNSWPYKEEGGVVQDTLAKTTVTFDPTTGEILDADMEINSAYNDMTTAEPPDAVYDLRAIVTHEVGHFIGIDHSQRTASVMYPTYDRGSIEQRKLSPDDIEAVCAAYPPDRLSSCDSIPRGGFAPTCPPPKEKGCSVGPAGTEGKPSDSGGAGVLVILGVWFSCVAFRRSRRFENRRIVR